MLSQESKQQIDREVAKYPAEQKQSAVMAALAIAPTANKPGWRLPGTKASMSSR